MIFFVIGAALGIGGMVTGMEWLIWVAIAVLIVGFVLRMVDRRGGGNPSDDGDHGNDSSDGSGPAAS